MFNKIFWDGSINVIFTFFMLSEMKLMNLVEIFWVGLAEEEAEERLWTRVERRLIRGEAVVPEK